MLSKELKRKLGFIFTILIISVGTNMSVARSSPALDEPENLFIDSAADPALDFSDDPLVVRSRTVTLNNDLLATISYVPVEKGFEPFRLNLNLFDDKDFSTLIERTDMDINGTLSMMGRIEGIESSEVTITINAGVMWANVVYPGGFYRVRYAGNADIHMIHEIDPAMFPPEHPEEYAQGFIAPPTEDEPPSANTQDLQGDDGSVIDLLVVYTPAAKAAVGGTASMNALIATAISETNTGYSNSGITTSVNLAASAEVTYTEDSFVADLALLQEDGEGFMDDVHTLRDSNDADAVILLINLTTYCGLAYGIMDPVSAGFASSAFAVAYWGCATGYYSFAHELGHLQSARHDWYVDPTNNSPFSYNHAYVRWEDDWRTIMGYNAECVDRAGSCTRINYWSNPNVLYGGDPTGVVDGTSTACTFLNLSNPECNAENWKTINNTAFIFSNFRNKSGSDSYEPDGSSGEANWITSGSQQVHNIKPAGDEDWVKFNVSELSEVFLETSGPSGDTRMWLYNSSIVQIGFDDDGGAGFFSMIYRYCGGAGLSAGTYYVKIDEFDDDDEINSYNIDLTITSCLDSYEPDDSPEQATTILDGIYQIHSIAPVEDEDWVKFTLGGESQIVLETSGPSGDTRMWLYDSDLGQLEYNDDGGAGDFSKIDRLCDVDALAAGTYYVKIDDWGDDTVIASYSIYLSVTPCSSEIFSDGFESGDLSAWYSYNTGNGDLYVCGTAAVEGSYGACVDVVSAKRKQMWDRSMTDASRYRARFYFDPNGLSMGNNEKIRLMQLRTGVDTIRPAFVQVRYINGGYEMRVRAQTDAGVTLSGSWYPIADNWVTIEIDWMAATGDGDDNGYVTLWLDGVEKGTISGIDNDTLLVNEIKLGFTSRLGTKIISGTFYLDAFISDSDAYIGLLP